MTDTDYRYIYCQCEEFKKALEDYADHEGYRHAIESHYDITIKKSQYIIGIKKVEVKFCPFCGNMVPPICINTQ